MNPNRPNILILGLAGAGKTTLATKLAKKLGYEVLSLDTYRYGPGWSKVAFKDFRKDVFDAACASPIPKVIESVYDDNSRIAIINELLPTVGKCYIIKPESLETIAAQLIDRCIERVLAREKGLPAIIETSLDRARLLISNITLYEDNVRELTTFHLETDFSVMLSRDDLTRMML